MSWDINPVRNNINGDLILGLCCLIFATLVLFVWIPLDVESGVIEKVRRRLEIGDSLAPSVAALFVFVGGFILITQKREASDQRVLLSGNYKYLSILITVLAISLILMRYAGPLTIALVNLTQNESLEYRLLRDTVAWKYIGFFLGGSLMVSGMISQIEGKLSWRSLSIAVLAVIAMILIFDVPFEDLLLPPNGDV